MSVFHLACFRGKFISAHKEKSIICNLLFFPYNSTQEDIWIAIEISVEGSYDLIMTSDFSKGV